MRARRTRAFSRSAGRRSAQDFLKEYLAFLEAERNYSPNTLAAYRSDLRQLLDEHVGLPGRRAVRRHFAKLRATKTPSSVKRALSVVRGFFGYLDAEGHVDSDPTVGLRVKVEQRLPGWLSRQQVEAVLAVCNPATALGLRDSAILHLLYATGIRVSELCGLTASSYLREERLLRVVGKGDKERMVLFGARAADLVDRYLENVRPAHVARAKRCDPLFPSYRGRPLDRRRVHQVVAACARSAGVTCSPHTFRHACATHLVEGGADLRCVQELLGHASLNSTQVYTHVDAKRLRATNQRYHPRA